MSEKVNPYTIETKHDDKIIWVSSILYFISLLIFRTTVLRLFADTAILLVLIFVGASEERLYKQAWLFVLVFLNVFLFINTNNRIDILIVFSWAIVATGIVLYDYFAYHFKDNEGNYFPRILFPVLMLLLFYMGFISRLNYENEGGIFLTTGVIGALVGVTLFMVLTQKVKLDRMRDYYIVSFLIAFMVFLMGGFLFQGLNYSLDYSDPSMIECEIVAMDHQVSSRGPDTYEITVIVNGYHEEIDVSRIKFESLNIGDEITLSEYQGFFNVSYIILE